MHGVHEDHPLPDPALGQGLLHLRRHVDIGPAGRRVESQFLPVVFHLSLSTRHFVSSPNVWENYCAALY